MVGGGGERERQREREKGDKRDGCTLTSGNMHGEKRLDGAQEICVVLFLLTQQVHSVLVPGVTHPHRFAYNFPQLAGM